MSKFKVVCNQGDYAYKFEDENTAIEAANRHNLRSNHYPIYIYEVDEGNDMTRLELLAIQAQDLTLGIINIRIV